MKRSLIALGILVLCAGSALAAPGDPRVVQGTLEWPNTLAAEPFIVLRGSDGRLYYSDISAAQRRTPGAITAGTSLAILGVEGGRPYELAAIAFGAGDAAALGLTTPSANPIPAASTPSTGVVTGPPGEPMWRLDGTVQAISGNMVTLRADDGKTHTVDVTQLSEATRKALRPGDRIALFGVPRNDRKLVANGYIQGELSTPSASPRTTR